MHPIKKFPPVGLAFLLGAIITAAHAATPKPESEGGAEIRNAGIRLELPDGLPDTLSLVVPFADRQLTLHLQKGRVFGQNTRFLVDDGTGSLTEIERGPDRSYSGRVAEHPDYAVSAFLTEHGLIANIIRPDQELVFIEPVSNAFGNTRHRVSVDDSGDQGICQHEGCNVAETIEVSSTPSTESGTEVAASNAPITTTFSLMGAGGLVPASMATLPPTRVMTVREFEVGVEIGSRAYVDNYGSNLASAQAAAASIATNMDARYLRGACIKHVLGTVIIRTNAGTDPLRSITSNSSGSLSDFRNYWNSNPGEVGTTHDLAVYHVRASPSGVAYVNSVGTGNRYALSCSNGPTSWANGTLVHEFGHSWNLRHTIDGPIFEYNYAGGATPPSSFYESKPRSNSGMITAGGSHTFVSVMHGGGSHNIGRLSTDEANTVYGVLQNKLSFGTVVASPGPVSPFGHRDSAFVTDNASVTIDVIANDYDANNDVLDAVLLDTVSHQGGTVTLSTGTGPGGRNQIVYTPPANPQGAADFFHYTVCDTTGRADWGAVYVTIGSDLLFAENFSYPAGALAGKTHDGNTWTDHAGGGGSSTVSTSISVDGAFPADYMTGGGKLTQVGSDRLSLVVPTEAAGGDDNSVRYISFVQKLSFADAGRSQVVEFWNGGASTNNTAFSFGTDTWPGAPDYGLFIDKNGGNVALEVGTLDAEAHLIVLKVEYGAEDADTISVFVDPGSSEPSTPDASSAFTNLAFNRIGFGCFQSGGQEVDEIRIGASFESVVPLEVPELFFEEAFPYAAGDLAGETNEGNAWQDEHDGASSTVDPTSNIAVSEPSGFLSSGGKLTQTSSDRYSLALSQDAAGGTDHTVRFISFVQKFGLADAAKTQIVEFWNGSASGGNSIFSYGTDANALAPDYGLFLDKSGGNVAIDLGSPDTDSHLIVFKVEYGAADADAISVYVDPGENLPAVPDAVSFYSDLSFDRIGFGSFQGGSQELDEIRIGASYRDVVPLAATGLLFEETFPYPAGSLTGQTKDGMNWSDHFSGGSTDVLSDASLPAFPGFISADGRVSQIGNDRQSLQINAAAAGGQDGSVRYISFIQKLGFADTGKSQIVEFWNGSASTNNTAFSFGTDTWLGAPDYGLLLDKNGENVALDLGSPDTDAHLIVLKVEYGVGNADTISVFFDPGPIEPFIPDATSALNNLAFNRIGFGSFQNGAQEVDEIRIGTSYEDVVPNVNPDSDFDGLPDDFERTYYHPTDLSVTDGTDDLDRDGMNDEDEFLAGTSATDPNSVLRISGIQILSESEMTIDWDSVSGIDYSIWAGEDLTTELWTRVVASKIATGSTTSSAVPRSGTAQFYQVRVNP